MGCKITAFFSDLQVFAEKSSRINRCKKASNGFHANKETSKCRFHRIRTTQAGLAVNMKKGDSSAIPDEGQEIYDLAIFEVRFGFTYIIVISR